MEEDHAITFKDIAPTLTHPCELVSVSVSVSVNISVG